MKRLLKPLTFPFEVDVETFVYGERLDFERRVQSLKKEVDVSQHPYLHPLIFESFYPFKQIPVPILFSSDRTPQEPGLVRISPLEVDERTDEIKREFIPVTPSTDYVNIFNSLLSSEYIRINTSRLMFKQEDVHRILVIAWELNKSRRALDAMKRTSAYTDEHEIIKNFLQVHPYNSFYKFFMRKSNEYFGVAIEKHITSRPPDDKLEHIQHFSENARTIWTSHYMESGYFTLFGITHRLFYDAHSKEFFMLHGWNNFQFNFHSLHDTPEVRPLRQGSFVCQITPDFYRKDSQYHHPSTVLFE